MNIYFVVNSVKIEHTFLLNGSDEFEFISFFVLIF